jgi:hypothetical protein
MNVYIGARDNRSFVAIVALPNPPEADPFLIHGLFTRLPRRLLSWLCQELLIKQ